MRLNHMNTQSILTVGEVVKIPLSQANLIKTPLKAPATTTPAATPTVDSSSAQVNGTPRIHIVGPTESLSSLAKEFHTTVNQLKIWNKMTGDVIIDGHKLIVGYIPFTSATSSSMTQNLQPQTQPAVATQSQTVQPKKDSVAVKVSPPVKKPQPKKDSVVVKTQPKIPPPVKTVVATVSVPVVDTASAGGTPITHIVGSTESLSTIAKKYKTTVAQLKTWNKLKSDIIIDGHSLIVGYTPVSGSAQMPAGAASQPTTQSASTQKNIVVQTPPQVQPSVEKVTKSSLPPATNTTKPETISRETTAAPTQPAVDISKIPAEGYFTSSFGLESEGRNLQTSTGTSMTFKTASGWDDKKYYILVNNVPPGSIVKVMSANNKVVYAKVLWNMKDMKENEGLDFRISTATAAALGLSDAKFPLTITYFE